MPATRVCAAWSSSVTARLSSSGADAFQELITADNLLTRAAMLATTALRGGPEPLSYVYAQFEDGNLELRAVAAERGVTASTLREQLHRLDPRWQTLSEPAGVIDRFALLQEFPKALCAVHAGARNRPVSCP